MQTDAPDRILRIKAVMERTGLTRSTLYRKIESGSFPPQIKLSERCAGWRESDVSEWMRNPMSYSITTAAAVKFRSRATGPRQTTENGWKADVGLIAVNSLADTGRHPDKCQKDVHAIEPSERSAGELKPSGKAVGS